ncbi:MAG: hypothetical protein ACIALR_14680 [Blastopirellula sp. JB062]
MGSRRFRLRRRASAVGRAKPARPTFLTLEMHQIATRSLTEQERKIVQVHAQPNAAAFGCLTVLLLVAPIVILLQLLGLVANHFSSVQFEALRLLAVAIPLIVYLLIIQSYWKRDRRRSRRAQQDLADDVVQEIWVTQPRVCEVSSDPDEPGLAFDLGDRKILLLSGPWLYYANTYQAETADAEIDAESDDALAKGRFPSTDFTVTRLPQTGYVLAIRVNGEYVEPERSLDALERGHRFRDSEILVGDLDEIADILSRAEFN